MLPDMLGQSTPFLETIHMTSIATAGSVLVHLWLVGTYRQVWTTSSRKHGRFRRRPLRGFTLVELLVVIAIIGILIAPAIAGGPGSPRGRPTYTVLQQSETDQLVDAQLSYHVP